MKALRDSKILICGIVRDAEPALRKNIPVMDRICDNALDYLVVVYENNSKDGTKDLLMKWQKGRKIKAFCSDNEIISNATIPEGVNPFFCARRIAKMVLLRNQYLDYVESIMPDFDYMIVVDLDVARISLDGVFSSFNTKEDWDAVTAYGHSLSPSLRERYHDTYALREHGYSGPQTEYRIRHLADLYSKRKIGRDLIRVDSAFGGLAIYRMEALSGVRYKLIHNEDDRVEVLCEHESIYRQMREHGFDRFFINPLMDIKYQKLSKEILVRWFRKILRRH